jgi:hypothetical protein
MMNRSKTVRRAALLMLIFLGLPPAARADEKPTPEGVEFFERKVRPLLVKHCYSCHSSEAKKLRGELLLDTREGVLRGGASGPVVVPGDPEKSPLIQAVRHDDESLKMPPKEKLSAAEIDDLITWVKMGTPDPRTGPGSATTSADPARGRDFWSFRPVKDHTPPEVRDVSWPLSDVDRFVLAELEKRGLRPAPAADKLTLIRRATFDLTGLPPTPDEIDVFLKDDSPNAYAKLIDRLLASPHYGERWGRHWLDVVRYADTAGDNSDYPIPQMYKYRNWVIEAFNRDLPYDEFIIEQLAGDLLPAQDDADRYAKVVATGYLANARRFGSYEDKRYPWHLTYEDTIDNLGRTFLGLTINCCRCHDHKFDPLTAEDYYALYGFFSSTRYPWPGIELDKVQRDLVPLASAKVVAAADRERKEKLAELDARIRQLEADKKEAEKAAKEKKDAEGKTKKEKDGETTPRLRELDEKLKAIRKQREDLARTPPTYETAYAVAEGKSEGRHKVGNAHVQLKGDPERPGKEVPRRFPTVLGGQELPPDTKGSGRVELAKWIADPKNPLTARVMVNRIWHYHFGRGIVPTPSDFGRQGLPPTHPELLDYLAARFVEGGWSVKAMHRLIMLSRSYQLSSREDAANARIDADNNYLWRFNRRRLDAESIRDAMLAVSGGLDRSPGGPHPFPDPTSWNYTQHNPYKAVYDSNRRSVYLMTQRIQRHPFLGLFDGADTNASTDRRVTSTTPLQALYLMNDPFVHTQARKFAERLLAERSDDTGRVEFAYRLAFGRPPTTEEQSAAREYLDTVGEKLRASGTGTDELAVRAWESFARVLFMSNEFVYVN